MKKFIGGLFKNRENVVKARNAFRANGLDDESINMLQCTHDKKAGYWIKILRSSPLERVR